MPRKPEGIERGAYREMRLVEADPRARALLGLVLASGSTCEVALEILQEHAEVPDSLNITQLRDRTRYGHSSMRGYGEYLYATSTPEALSWARNVGYKELLRKSPAQAWETDPLLAKVACVLLEEMHSNHRVFGRAMAAAVSERAGFRFDVSKLGDAIRKSFLRKLDTEDIMQTLRTRAQSVDFEEAAPLAYRTYNAALGTPLSGPDHESEE